MTVEHQADLEEIMKVSVAMSLYADKPENRKKEVGVIDLARLRGWSERLATAVDGGRSMDNIRGKSDK